MFSTFILQPFSIEKGDRISRTRYFTAFLVSLLIVALLSDVGVVSGQDKHEEFYRFVQTIQDILAGKNTVEAQASISRGARLIYGARFENLQSVVGGEITGLTLADTSYHGVMIQAQTNPSEDAGFLVLKTEKYDTTKVRFHTITFMKDSTGRYQVNVWHAGACNP